jgi:RNA polymerase sigma factor (sigma-70 family)
MVKDHGRAEDITQEVFISALRRMRETDRSIIFKPWVYEIAKNACIDAFRRSRRAEEISYDADGGLGPADHGKLVSTTPTPDAAVDTRMSLDHLRGAFGGLSETHHDILVMRELEGLSYREIGQRLGMSRPSVESTLFRARRRLTEEYEELTSGERCLRTQALIAEVDGRRMGVRDERKMSRHLSHCQPCRRAACAAGLDVAAITDRKSLREKIAALLPIPAFARRRWFGGDGGDAGGGAVARWSSTASQLAEPASGWVKAAAVAAVAVAGVGTGVGVTHGTSRPAVRDHAPAAASSSATGSGSTSSAARPVAPAGGAKTAGATTGRSTRTTGGARPSGAAKRGGSSARGSTPARGGGSSGGSAGGSAGGKAADRGGTAAGGSGGGAGDSASGAVNKVKDTVDKTVDGATKTASGTTKKATDTVSGTVKKTTDAVDKATNNATAPVSGAVNGAINTATGAVNDTVNTATGAVNTVTDSVPNPPPVSVPSVTVPTPGGSVTTPSVSVPTPTVPGLPVGSGG